MEDTTKVGLAAGAIGVLAGAIATYIACKEDQASKYALGMANGVAMAQDKCEALKRQIAECESQIARLQHERDSVLHNLNQRYACFDSLLDLIRAKNLITEDTYTKFINSTARQRNELFLAAVDMAINHDDQARKILQGQQGYGTVDVSLLENQQSVGVPIVFSPKVRGGYRWPKSVEAILPEDETILASSALFSKIKDLIPGWEMESYGRSRDRQLYDYACICRNALKELDKRQILCDGISYDEDGYEYVNGKIVAPPSPVMDPNDYAQWCHDDCVRLREEANPFAESKFRVENACGVVTSAQLDDYIKQKCDYVRNAIAAFVTTNYD